MRIPFMPASSGAKSLIAAFAPTNRLAPFSTVNASPAPGWSVNPICGSVATGLLSSIFSPELNCVSRSRNVANSFSYIGKHCCQLGN